MTDLTVVEQTNTVTIINDAASLSVNQTTNTAQVSQTTQTLVVQQADNTIQITAAGPQGPPGPSDAFVYEQTSPSSEWYVVHNIGRLVNVSYVDPAGYIEIADANHIDVNTVHAVFPAPTTGKLVCS